MTMFVKGGMLLLVAASLACGGPQDFLCDCNFSCPSLDIEQIVGVGVCATEDDALSAAAQKCVEQFSECTDAACPACQCRSSQGATQFCN